jgi:UDP-GlcNAc:undecaprenyl-phosphate GlcNAc-1-phosphate transferase
MRFNLPLPALVSLTSLTAFILSLFLTPLVRHVAVRMGWVSRPVEDRWGKRVVARLGGVAMYLAFLLTGLLFLPLTAQTLALLIGISCVFAIGLVDDLQRMRPHTKLILQLAASSVMVFLGVRIEIFPSPWLSMPLSIFWLVTIMNALNLLDNMDGLAAGVSAIGGVFCAIHAFLAGQPVILLLSLILVATCLGFLWSNFPPARIFMGDSGSHILGMSLGSLVLMESWQQSTHLLTILAVPVFVLAVPIFDMCFVTLQRILHGRSPFQGGTDHVSHRLAILGLSPRQTVLVLYLLSAAMGVVSIFSVRVGPLLALASWLGCFALFLVVAGYLAKVRVYSVPRAAVRAPWDASDPQVTWIDTMLFHKRRILEVLIDFFLICGAYIAAHLLRFEGELVMSQQRLLLQSLPLILVVQLISLAATRLYHGVWRYISISDLVNIFKGVSFGAILSAMAALYLWRFEGFSRAVFIIYALLLFVSISASRIGEKAFDQWLTRALRGAPALIIGAGDMGELTLRQLTHHQQHKQRVIGFLDDDLLKQVMRIHGLPVLGTRAALHYLIDKYGVTHVVIAMQAPPDDLVRHVQQTCERLNVRWQTVTTLVAHS